MIILVIITM
ncbi:hypothetical protein BLA29_015432 [Euroglyphus maynei]|uniref:Uncharacterized protein n=1 Tax=Euroglyphus maynei TaxID=6958 RepID=A0A1Y3AUL7_EURMA|nr:hypothetical protein BLA29_015432 [Euroglyphus maynei]